jgi:hypothetical protein
MLVITFFLGVLIEGVNFLRYKMLTEAYANPESL